MAIKNAELEIRHGSMLRARVHILHILQALNLVHQPLKLCTDACHVLQACRALTWVPSPG